MTRSRLGWLGPAIVLIGAAIAAVGVWYFVHARPTPGDVIDRIPIAPALSLVVRREVGGDRAFVELREGDRVVWQALVPPYGGRPGARGIAWSLSAVSVRVIRDRRAELFVLAMQDATKLGSVRLAREHGPIVTDATGPITLTDHARTYEIVSGADWHQLVAVDLATGRVMWSRELGPTPVTSGDVAGRQVTIQQGARTQAFDGLTGADWSTIGILR
jgi:hypothetical protein